MTELVFKSIHQITHADWLLRGRYFTILTSRSIRFFLRPLSFGGKISKSNRIQIKENLVSLFKYSKQWHVLEHYCRFSSKLFTLKNTINESRIDVNKKRHKKANRIKYRQTLKIKTLQTSKPCNKFLINLVCWVCTGNYLPIYIYI